MADEPDYDPVACPVARCSYRAAPRSVAAHVSGTADGRHDWDRLPHDSARAFVMVEKRRQLSERGASVPGDGAGGDPDGGAAAASAGEVTASASPDEAGADGDAAGTPLDATFADDALAVLALLDRYDTSDLDDLETDELANLYIHLSRLRSTADEARQQVRDELLDAVPEGWSTDTDYGAVRRQSQPRRRLKDDETVWRALARAGVEPTDVMSLDESKVTDVVEEGRLDEESVFDTEEVAYVQRVDVDEDRREELLADLDPSVRSLLERP